MRRHRVILTPFAIHPIPFLHLYLPHFNPSIPPLTPNDPLGHDFMYTSIIPFAQKPPTESIALLGAIYPVKYPCTRSFTDEAKESRLNSI